MKPVNALYAQSTSTTTSTLPSIYIPYLSQITSETITASTTTSTYKYTLTLNTLNNGADATSPPSTTTILLLTANKELAEQAVTITVTVGTLQYTVESSFNKAAKLSHNLFVFSGNSDSVMFAPPLSYSLLYHFPPSFVCFLFLFFSVTLTIPGKALTSLNAELITSSRTTSTYQTSVVAKLPSNYTPTTQHQGPLGPTLLKTSYQANFS